jgi:uncharacterized membrane protein
MNVHPIFVHFPIALLTLYALIELARFPILERMQSLQNTKLFLLFVGTLAVLPTLVAGKLAQWSLDVPSGSHTAEVIRIHSYFALSTAIVFSILSIAYCSKLYLDHHNQSANNLVIKLATITKIQPLVLMLAFIGVVLIFITGTLGGTIVYGPDLDPITRFVNHVIFGS